MRLKRLFLTQQKSLKPTLAQPQRKGGFPRVSPWGFCDLANAANVSFDGPRRSIRVPCRMSLVGRSTLDRARRDMLMLRML